MNGKLNLIFFLFLSCISTIQTFSQTATAPAVGNGSSGSPYEIASLENLFWIQSNTANWDKHYIQTANINASATSSWNSNTGWMPIGNATTRFTGSYNGQGFEISGLRINRSTVDFQGLFGDVNNANLRNIRLVSASISGRNNVGGIAGRALLTYINGCVLSSSSVTGTTDNIGGWVGQHTYGDTINVYNITMNTTIRGREQLGGFFGQTNAPISFYNCHNQGSITSSNASGSSNVGGLVGLMSYTATTHTPVYSHCTNSGTINGASGDNVAGIVGLLSRGEIK